MNALIVNYNTQELTDAVIMSLNKHTPGCKVYVFDNSDEEKYRSTLDNVEVIDNSYRQIIDFDEWLRTYPDKYPRVGNGYGSAKHCKSVDICFDLIPDGFFLLDSDILIRQDISSMWDERYAATGEIVLDKHHVQIPRLAPYLCYINVPMCREFGVRYFNGRYMWKLCRTIPERFYDTGAWFLRRLGEKGLQIKKYNINDYMLHLRNGSWRNTDYREWLNQYKELWQKK